MKLMQTLSLSMLVILSPTFFINTASAADQKMISSAICQAKTDAGAQNLIHRGSSLEASGADVTVICPIIKDTMGNKLLWVNVRHKGPGTNADNVSGRVLACNSTWGGCWQTNSATVSDSGGFTSVFLETDDLTHSADDYFYYTSVLKEGWKIVSISYKEE